MPVEEADAAVDEEPALLAMMSAESDAEVERPSAFEEASTTLLSAQTWATVEAKMAMFSSAKWG